MIRYLLLMVAVAASIAAQGDTGTVEIDITDVAGKALNAHVDLIHANGKRYAVPVPTGRLKAEAPAGEYEAHVYVYDDFVPMLVAVKSVTVVPDDTAFLLVNLYEGVGGRLRLRDFDSDGDLVIDGAEIDGNTDGNDPTSYPGAEKLEWPTQKLSDEARWYRGELNAYSKYGRGKESVSKLIRRAEKAELDFLAITDRNSLEACLDEDFVSDELVLIPAMEWGNDERGVALIYGPGTKPTPPETFGEAQALCLRVQAQGGVFAVAHPCLRELPWTWGLSYVNAVQVWYQDWRSLPPLELNQLDEDLRVREPGSLKLVHSIAAAAAAKDAAPESIFGIELPDLGVSANRQSLLFCDFEHARGLLASVLGGSGAASSKMALGEPVTYVYAEEQSLRGILDGIRWGRTYISSGLDGPELLFAADVLKDQTIDVSIGGVIPIGADVMFHVGVRHGKGKKIRLFRDGQPIATRDIYEDPYMHIFEEKPTAASAYRIAVVSMPEELTDPKAAKRGLSGYGAQDFHALSSPIYSRDITENLLENLPNIDPRQIYVQVPRDDRADKVAPPLPIAQSEEW